MHRFGIYLAQWRHRSELSQTEATRRINEVLEQRGIQTRLVQTWTARQENGAMLPPVWLDLELWDAVATALGVHGEQLHEVREAWSAGRWERYLAALEAADEHAPTEVRASSAFTMADWARERSRTGETYLADLDWSGAEEVHRHLLDGLRRAAAAVDARSVDDLDSMQVAQAMRRGAPTMRRPGRMGRTELPDDELSRATAPAAVTVLGQADWVELLLLLGVGVNLSTNTGITITLG